jgi:epoxyqueuosine reductase
MNTGDSRSLEDRIEDCARDSGIETVGFARMEGLESLFHESMGKTAARFGYGISLGFRLSDVVLDDLVDGPTLLYKHQYKTANWMLDQCAARIVRLLESVGGSAVAIPASQTIDWQKQLGHLSHKAVAARSGLGWIGRSGLLVNEKDGARLRFSSVLTDVTLAAGEAVDGSCGDCTRCIDLCPAGAITLEGYRMDKCLEMLKTFSGRRGIGVYICGMCVKACPISK